MPNDEVNSEPNEPNWDLYKGDVKVSKMIINRPRPILNFEIPVISQPPRHRPGSVPPSQPVELRLVDDSTAFIVDKVILPIEPLTEVGDPRQRRAYYIIGWPDLPAARPVVDCAKALDYVAPYAIEEWEHEHFLRREAEKEQAETEVALKAVAEAVAAEKGKGVDADVLPNGKKKPGRKPKNARLQNARPPTPQLDREQEELLAKRRQGPSLSTPQKRRSRIAQLEAEMRMEPLDQMDGDAESDEEIRWQLEKEGLRSVATFLGELDVKDRLRAGTAATELTRSSRTSSGTPFSLQDRVPQRRGNLSLKGARSNRVSPLSSSMQQQVASDSAMSSHVSQIQKPVSTTPIPLPQRPGFGPTSSFTSSHGPPVVPSIEAYTPSSQGQSWATNSATATFKAETNVVRAPSLSDAAHTSKDIRSGFTPTNSFTPVGGHFPRPPKRAADESPTTGNRNEGTLSGNKIKRERKKKAPKLSQPPPSEAAADPSNEPQAEQEYMVKRLEGDSIVDGIQYFRVRWEGDWPPEQNPTWEPRENISTKLVKAYLKRKAEKSRSKSTHSKGPTGGAKEKSKEKHQSTLEQWASRLNYSSVSEAFEGQAELDQMNRRIDDDHDPENDEELGTDAEEFLVVDKRKAEERAKAAAERRKSLSSQVAAEFANVGPGRPSGF